MSRHVLTFAVMAKKANTITIDLDKWTTQTNKAKLLGLNESTIRQRVIRTKQGKGNAIEEYLHIPELNLTLVRKP
jgi:hypothetical protein